MHIVSINGGLVGWNNAQETNAVYIVADVIEDKEMLLKTLQASVVPEYNGKWWHNVHSLVVKFLKEQGLIRDVGE